MTTHSNPSLVATDNTKVDDITYSPFSGAIYEGSIGLSLIGGVIDTRDVSYRDVDQGALGDCYLMAALAEIAQHREKTVFDIIQPSGSNLYEVNIAGTSFTIDNQLPRTKWGGSVYAGYTNGTAWVAMIEKAYAIANSKIKLQGPANSGIKVTYDDKVTWYNPFTWFKTPSVTISHTNSYGTIEGGWGEPALVDLFHGGGYEQRNVSSVLEADMQKYFNADRPTIFSTVGEGKKKKSGLGGFVTSHAYSVINYKEDTNTYVLFNPWNSGTDYTKNSSGSYGSVFEVTYNDLISAGNTIGWWNPSTNLSLVADTIVELKPPTDILIYELPSRVRQNQGLTVKQIWASDPNGWSDLSSIRFWLEDNQGQKINLGTVDNGFSAFVDNPIWADIPDQFFSLSQVGVGNYTFKAQAEDEKGSLGTIFSQSIEIKNNLNPTALNIYEVPKTVSMDQNLNIRQIWASDPDGWQDISYIDYWMIDPNGNLIELRDSNQFTPWEDDPVNYINPDFEENNVYSTTWAGGNDISFTATEYAQSGEGLYTFYAQVYDSQGQTIEGIENYFVQEIEVLPANNSTVDLLIYDLPSEISKDQNLEFNQIWAWDSDGWQDINYIDYRIYSPSGTLIDLRDSTEFYPWEDNNSWAEANYISFEPSEYAISEDGVYQFEAQVVDKQGNASSFIFKQNIILSTPLDDPYEMENSNNNLNNSFSLEYDPNTWLRRIHGVAVQGDDDWYTIDLQEDSKQLKVDLLLDQNDSLNLSIHDKDGKLIRDYQNISGEQSIALNLIETGLKFIRVYGENQGTSYDLKWQGIAVNEKNAGLDIDGDGKINMLTDGLLFLGATYYYENIEDKVQRDTLITSFVNTIPFDDQATRKTPEQIIDLFEKNSANLDIDGSGKANFLTDGLLFLGAAYYANDEGVIDQTLMTNFINTLPFSDQATRKDFSSISNFLETLAWIV